MKNKNSGLIVKVKKQTALNPVARAIARARLHEVIIKMRIKLLMLDEGEESAEYIMPLALPVYAIAGCLEKMGEIESRDYRLIKSGCKVLLEISERGFRWRKADAITMDNSLEICERRWPRLDPRLLNEEIHRLESS